MSRAGCKYNSSLSIAMPGPAVSPRCLNSPPPPPPRLFAKFPTLPRAVLKSSVEMLCPNAPSWRGGSKSSLPTLLLLHPTSCRAEFPTSPMRKCRIVAAINTTAEGSWFTSATFVCAGGVEFTWWGGGRRDKCFCLLSNLASWAITLFVSCSWVAPFVCKGKRSAKLMNDGSGKQNL